MTRPALLVMDLQNAMVGRVKDSRYVRRVAGAIGAARDAGIPVMYVVVGFRPGHPEVSAANKTFGAIPPPAFTAADPDAAIHPDVAPLADDVVITKRRVSAFTGSDLDVVLRATGVDRLVLSGIATSGVVLSTLRQAADLDYRLTVLADGCYDPDPEVHRVLTEKVFPRQAEVVDVEDWISSLA
ncbi:cysteine hydrolase family protein [Actinopolymorpha rutila]|uniref:Nicotinamidase-related amidase n=1 Tax=Actinopolymorpha rutila TaxID=446787 RepID=A0A852ZID1_9ACTN|nr:isochorismatase family cysteine hydrolase [Actinopolymorpha rutila]NYH91402.1 nicotinamidase-related amidase [Actinopolymorpha rutila]